MAHDESSLVDEFREDFRALCGQDALWLKIAGGPYQHAGMPDVFCATSFAASAVEFKFARTSKQVQMHPVALIMDELSPRQRLELVGLARLNGPLRPRVVVGAEVEHPQLPGGAGTFAFAVEYQYLASLNPTARLVDYMLDDLNRRLGNAVQCRTICAETQLRCRGERWDVRNLLFRPGEVWHAAGCVPCRQRAQDPDPLLKGII